MSTPAAKQYDEALINFYDEQLVAHADTVYRFAFALTLSLDEAMRVVRRTYQSLSANLEKVHAAGDVSAMTQLIGEAWKVYGSVKGNRPVDAQSAVTRALKPMALEPRAALVAVDVAGLSPTDAARALGWSEKDLRTHLAGARRTLMMSSLDI